MSDEHSLQKQPQPFESWFEADVALELLRKRLYVFSQYKVGFKRIDLVVESGNQRLAIECDGDYWHGAEQYEADMDRQRQLVGAVRLGIFSHPTIGILCRQNILSGIVMAVIETPRDDVEHFKVRVSKITGGYAIFHRIISQKTFDILRKNSRNEADIEFLTRSHGIENTFAAVRM